MGGATPSAEVQRAKAEAIPIIAGAVVAMGIAALNPSYGSQPPT
jgi:hypothetical protein